MAGITGEPGQAGEPTAGTAARGVSEGVGGPRMPAPRVRAAALAAMLTVTCLAVVPPLLVLMAAFLASAGHGVLIVNGSLSVAGPVRPALAVTAVLLIAGSTAAATVAMAACAPIVAGAVTGRPVAAGPALRLALRRSPALVALLGVAVVVAVIALAAGFGTILLGWPLWLVIAVMVIIVCAAVRFMLALPAAILEGRGPFSALRRAGRLAKGRRMRVTMVLAGGCWAVPAVVGWELRQLAGSSAAWELAGNAVSTAISVAVIPFAAMVLTLTYLSQPPEHYPRPWPDQSRRIEGADLAAVAARLPAPPPGRPPRLSGWRLAAAAAASTLLPGLLYGVVVAADPFGVPVMSQHVLATTQGEEFAFDAGHGAAFTVVSGAGAGLSPSVQACTPGECFQAATPSPGRGLGCTHVQGLGSAPLSQGGVGIVTWVSPCQGSSERLVLVRCRDGRCGSLSAGRVLTVNRVSSGFDSEAAMTALGGGLVVAHLEPIRLDGMEALRLTWCASPLCARPRTFTLAHLLPEAYRPGTEPVAVAVGRGGQVIAAYVEPYSGAVYTAACPSVQQCAHPVVRRPVPPGGSIPFGDVSGVSAVIAAGGRPVVAWLDVRSGATRLLSCTTWDCTSHAAVTLTGPGLNRAPALAIGPGGLPLVATWDPPSGRLALITCHTPDCRRRSETMLGQHAAGAAPGQLGLLVTADGRPEIFSAGDPPGAVPYLLVGYPVPLSVTVCARPGCAG